MLESQFISLWLAKFDEILFKAKVVVECQPVTTALRSFKVVQEKCFGQDLIEGYQTAIAQFSSDYRKTAIKEPTLKVHILEAHVVQFLDRQKQAYPGKGLGYWSEQASESVHYDWDNLWTGNKYKRELKDKNHDTQLKKCGVTYNSRHM